MAGERKDKNKPKQKSSGSLFRLFLLGVIAALCYLFIFKKSDNPNSLHSRSPAQFVYRPEEWPTQSPVQSTTGYIANAPAFNERRFSVPGIQVPSIPADDWGIPITPSSVYGTEGCAAAKGDLSDTGRCYWPCGQLRPARPGGGAGNGNCLRPEDRSSCTSGKKWVLTFDDGPTSDITPKVLDSLKKKGIKATFFLCGFRMVSNPDLVRRIYDEGHELGIHTWSHHALTTLPSQVILAELMWTMKAFHDILGVVPRFMRPPLGDIDDRVRKVAQGLGLTVVMWNLDTKDFSITSDIIYATSKADWENLTKLDSVNSNYFLGIINLQHDTVEVALQFFDQIVHPRVVASGWMITDLRTCLEQSSYIVGTGSKEIDGNIGITSKNSGNRIETATMASLFVMLIPFLLI